MSKTAAPLTPANLATMGDVDKMLNYLMTYGNSTTTNIQPKASTKTTKRPKVDGFDCLADDSRSQSTLPSYRRKAASDAGSKGTGTTFAGKDHSTNRYLGKGFAFTTGCSPGPIYAAPTSMQEGLSVSFSHAERMPVDSVTREKANTPAPDRYDIPGTVGGKQVLGSYATSAASKFSVSQRFGPEKMFDVPGPGAFHPDILREDPTKTRNTYNITFSTGHRNPKSLFISRMHVADAIGTAHLGGPASYSLPDPQLESGHYSVRTTTFQKEKVQKRRVVSSNAGDESVMSGDTTTVKTTSDHHSRLKVASISPGPARYSPNYSILERREPHITFPKAQGSAKKNFTGKAFMTMGEDSPGPQYLPELDKKLGAATFADADPNMGRMSTRFLTKLYHGKGIGELPGQDSPGPASYSPQMLSEAPAATLVWKEGVTDRPIISGPKHARFVSKEISSKENFGVYSPGPKYMLEGTFGHKKGPPGSCSFGISDKHFVGLTPEHMAKFGTASKLYTSPGEVKFISVEHSKMSMIGKTSPGPGNVPNDESMTTSKFKRQPAVTIESRHAREEIREANVDGGPPPLHPRLESTKPNLQVHKFSPTNPRAGSLFAPKKETVPASAEYRINEVSQLMHVPAGRLGVLGGPLSPPKKQVSENAVKKKDAEKERKTKTKKKTE